MSQQELIHLIVKAIKEPTDGCFFPLDVVFEDFS